VSPEQIALFEPSGAEVHALARRHLKSIAVHERWADIWSVRGASVLELEHRKQAARLSLLVDELCMLAEFEALAGLA